MASKPPAPTWTNIRHGILRRFSWGSLREILRCNEQLANIKSIFGWNLRGSAWRRWGPNARFPPRPQLEYKTLPMLFRARLRGGAPPKPIFLKWNSWWGWRVLSFAVSFVRGPQGKPLEKVGWTCGDTRKNPLSLRSKHRTNCFLRCLIVSNACFAARSALRARF